MRLLSTPPLRIVPDSNVLISGGTISTAPPSEIITSWRAGKVEFALCDAILIEVRKVLCRPYFAQRVGWSQQTVTSYVNQLRKAALIVPAKTKLNVCRDPHDNVVFACALEAQADYIVSGDKDVLEVGVFLNIPTVSPSQFIEAAKARTSRTKAA